MKDIDPDCIPHFEPSFDFTNNPNASLYKEAIRNTLKKILPANFRVLALHDPDLIDDQREAFHSSLPLLVSTPCEKAPTTMSFYILSKFRLNAFKFFFDMICNWLVPGQRMNVLLCHAIDFRIPDLSEDVLTLCEVMIQIENEAEREELLRNWPIIETEIRLGMQMGYYARRILEIKGLTADAKTASIQEYIAYLISRLPQHFDHNLLTEMQHVLVMCRDEFKADRECQHLSRIISVHYLFRKALRESVKEAPEKRHLSLKLFKAFLRSPTETKPVLGVVVGINFLQDKEVFEERHLLNAIQNYIPTAQAVEHSFFSNRRGNESICTLYLELEKSNGEAFTGDEIRLLRQELPTDLKDRIEHLMHPIFMPRNEEEIMRNILSLSNQIKFLHDLPQVIISFDKQTHSDLYFNVILVEIRNPGSLSVQERFNQTDTILEYIHDRSKMLGVMRRKYVKEASVFGIKLQKHQFLRRDHSIDLNKARQTVVAELNRVLGEIRDFNGGMISKQHELLCAVRDELSQVKYNELLLENFFYSLTPDVMRAVLEPGLLKSLFLLLLESIQDGFFSGETRAVKIQRDAKHICAIVKTEDRTIKEELSRALSKFDQQPARMASSLVLVYDITYLGYLYIGDDPVLQDAFCETLKASLKELVSK